MKAEEIKDAITARIKDKAEKWDANSYINEFIKRAIEAGILLEPQPMETAPKDGTWVWVRDSFGGWVTATFSDGLWWATGAPFGESLVDRPTAWLPIPGGQHEDV